MFEVAAMNEFQYAWLLVYLFEALLFIWMYYPVMHRAGNCKWKDLVGLSLLVLAYVLGNECDSCKR